MAHADGRLIRFLVAAADEVMMNWALRPVSVFGDLVLFEVKQPVADWQPARNLAKHISHD
jgi:hypothetical protein